MIADALEYGVRIFTAESMHQYDEIVRQVEGKESRKDKEQTTGADIQIKVLPRLSNGAQFGMDESCVEEIIRDRDKHISWASKFPNPLKRSPMQAVQKQAHICQGRVNSEAIANTAKGRQILNFIGIGRKYISTATRKADKMITSFLSKVFIIYSIIYTSQ